MSYLKNAFVFLAVCPWRRKLIVGRQTPYEAVFALLGLTIVTAASFAVAINAIPHSEVAGSALYFLTSTFVVLLSCTLAAAKDETGDYELQNDRTTLWSCFLVNVATVFFTIVFISFAANGWFPGQQPVRHDYTAADVKCAAPIRASQNIDDPNVLGMFGSAAADDEADFKALISWFTAFSKFDATKQDILIVQQYPAFDQDYNTFSAVMTFNSNVVFKNALVFIRRSQTVGSGTLIYHLFAPDGKATDSDLQQLRIPRSQNAIYPVITVSKPNKGDQLIILVQVEAPREENNHDVVKKGKELPQNSGDFKFTLRRVQR